MRKTLYMYDRWMTKSIEGANLLRIISTMHTFKKQKPWYFICMYFIVFAQEGEQKKVSDTHNSNKFILALDDDFDSYTG